MVSAQHIGRWEKLGEKSVNYKTERDVIRAGGRGTFSKLKIHVKGNAVDFDKVIVKFANGSSQELKIRQVIQAGGETREIDLRGNKRVIKEIVFYYKSVKSYGNGRSDRHGCNHGNNGKRKATVSVWGRH